MITQEKNEDEEQSLLLNLSRQNSQLQQENKLLRGQIRLLKSKRFGRSSEKSDVDQPSLFDEAEIEDGMAQAATSESGTEPESDVEVKAHKRNRGGRKPLPADLPRVEVIHQLPESELKCKLDGHLLQEIGRETTEQLEMIPAKMRVVRHVQIKYGCPHCRKGVKTAPKPPQPIRGGIATPSLLAFVATSKYVDGLPLYRLENIMQRHGVELPRTTQANWMIRMGQEVQPLINLMRDTLLGYDILRMDETRVQVLKEKDKKPGSNSYMWVQLGGPPDKPVLLFDYHPSRGAEVPEALLEGYKGFLQTDGYEGYRSVEAAPGIVRLGCMAHARRKFDEALRSVGKKKRPKSLAAQAIKMIAKLYGIEKRLRKEKATPEKYLQVRQDEARPILDELKKWLDEVRPTALPSGTTGKALTYLHNQWDRLVRYLDDGRLEIDNNAIERAIRPFTIGRKNWLFSDSVSGAKSSANLYSLVESAKANGLEPFDYLQQLFTALPTAKTVEDYDVLLPWNISPTEKSTDG